MLPKPGRLVFFLASAADAQGAAAYGADEKAAADEEKEDEGEPGNCAAAPYIDADEEDDCDIPVCMLPWPARACERAKCNAAASAAAERWPPPDIGDDKEEEDEEEDRADTGCDEPCMPPAYAAGPLAASPSSDDSDDTVDSSSRMRALSFAVSFVCASASRARCD